MLTERQLIEIGDTIAILYEGLSADIAASCARILFATTEPETRQEWKKIKLRATANAQRQITRLVDKFVPVLDKTLLEHIPALLISSAKRDASIIGDDLVTPAIRDAMDIVANAAYRQTAGTLRNLTQTTASGGAAARFVRVMDSAYLRVSAGVTDYNTAMTQAARTYALGGDHLVEYDRSADKIEVAARRAVVTGVNQGALRMTDTLCDDLGNDLVEVSAHAGARPEHAAWQGKIYSRSGKSTRYPPLSVTGYGTGAGLGGWNCRHTMFPCIDGSPRAYSQATLSGYEDATVTINDREISVYAASQAQRARERQIRQMKREFRCLPPANYTDLPPTVTQADIDAAVEDLRKFCRQGEPWLRYDAARLYVPGFDGAGS